jgi:hypothetical protein
VQVEGKNGIADFAFWADGNGMTVASKAGEVSEFSIEARAVVARWHDEGAVGTTVVALGGRLREGEGELGGNRWVAVGSTSGVVNLYDRRGWKAKEGGVPEGPKPARVLMQLVTPISVAVFSPDGQVLAIGSRWKRDALRLGE